MDDLSGKIAQLLSDPKTMEQIKGLSQMLGGTNNPEPPNNSNSQKQEVKKESNNSNNNIFNNNSSNSNANPLAALTGSSVSPELLQSVMKIAPLLSSINKEDETTRFIYALKPMLSKSRQKRLDEALKMLQLMKILPLLKGSGFLNGIL